MNFLRSFLPGSTLAGDEKNYDLEYWQSRFLQINLLINTFLGLIISGLSFSSSIDSGSWALFTVGALLFAASIILLAFRRISYWTRSIIALVVFYIFTNLIFIHNSWSISSLILLLGFSLLASMLLFQNFVKIGIGISLATIVLWFIFHLTNLAVGPNFLGVGISLAVELIAFFSIGIIGNLAIYSFKRRLIEYRNSSSASEQKILELEEKLSNQESSLDRRLYQLTTASEISQKVSSIIDPQVLLRQVADLVKERFDLYYVGVFLVDKAKEYAVLEYGTGEAGKRMLASKHRLAIGGFSMIGWTTQNRKPRIALDTGDDAVHFDNPFLPETRSELALPIISGTNLLGALTIQSNQANAFDNNDILVLQSLADTLGVALENANSFLTSQAAFEEIRNLNQAYMQQNWWTTLSRSNEYRVDYESDQLMEPKPVIEKYQVPIRIRDEVIGQFTFEVQGKKLDQDQIDFVNSISTQTSIALENARLLSETQRSALQEQKINELTAQFSKSMTIEDIIKSAVSEFGKLPMISEASISLLPPDETDLKMLPDREVK